MTWFILVLSAYLLGAIPFGLLIGRTLGVDIRKHGSGNIGATNAGRILGRKWGWLCLVFDILKGLIPTLAASFLIVRQPIDAAMLWQWIAVGVAAVLGHTFPVYLGFRGGKGVATTIGVALGIYPVFTIAIAVALVAYAAVRFGTGLVALGSLTLAVVFPLAVLMYASVKQMSADVAWPLYAVSAALGLLIIVRHRSNIAKLVRGEET
jgi:glycerol-3-phosphate acyltransferase PlsY